MKKRHLSLKASAITFVLLVMAFVVYTHLHQDRRNLFVRDFYFKRNLERINQAIILYAEENEEMPPASIWADLIEEKNKLLFKKDFVTPMSYSQFGIYYNNVLENKSLSSFNKDTVVLFTAKGEWNSSGNKKVFLEKSVNLKRSYVITLNGDIYTYNSNDGTYIRLKDAQIIKPENLYWDK